MIFLIVIKELSGYIIDFFVFFFAFLKYFLCIHVSYLYFYTLKSALNLVNIICRNIVESPFKTPPVSPVRKIRASTTTAGVHIMSLCAPFGGRTRATLTRNNVKNYSTQFRAPFS